jgi:hypothetical protein
MYALSVDRKGLLRPAPHIDTGRQRLNILLFISFFTCCICLLTKVEIWVHNQTYLIFAALLVKDELPLKRIIKKMRRNKFKKELKNGSVETLSSNFH